MLRIEPRVARAPLNVLCLGAHSDDIEIGCGATLMRMLAERALAVRWIVFGCSVVRAEEARQSAQALLGQARESRVDVHDFRDAFFPHQAAEIKEIFELVKSEMTPDVIFTHTRHDLHQDHRVINQLTWNTFRDHLILEYEVPKYDGDLVSPNVFVDVEPEFADRKIAHLVRYFETQRDKRWFDEETFRGLLRLRGIEAGVRYAEGFHCRKLLV
jgi:LmbE family N-acetylglucosaminyl deacetylase